MDENRVPCLKDFGKFNYGKNICKEILKTQPMLHIFVKKQLFQMGSVKIKLPFSEKNSAIQKG